MTSGGLFHICASGAMLHPTIFPLQPLRMPRRRSRWSAERTGRDKHIGRMPYRPPHSWSWRCNHSILDRCMSGFSWSFSSWARVNVGRSPLLGVGGMGGSPSIWNLWEMWWTQHLRLACKHEVCKILEMEIKYRSKLDQEKRQIDVPSWSVTFEILPISGILS